MGEWQQTIRRKLAAIEDRMPVRMQIAAGSGAAVILLVGALAAGAAYLSYANTKSLVNRQLASVAATTADRIDRFIALRQREVLLFAQLEPLRNMWQNDPDALRRALEQLQMSFADLTWIGFARPDGIVVAATERLLEGASVAERPWFKQGLLGPAVGDVHEAKLLSSLLKPRPNGEPYRFVDVAMPVRNAEGVILGVLGGHINWDRIAELTEAAQNSDGDTDTTISVFSSDGGLLLGPGIGSPNYSGGSLAKIRKTNNGAISEVTADGGMLTAFRSGEGYRDYKGLNWIVAASQPSSVALAAAIFSAQAIIGIGAIAGLIGIVLSLALARRIARPIQAITAEADRIGRASGPVMLPRQGGSVEVVQLNRALRSLLRRIGFAEERVKEAETRATENARTFKHDLTELRRLADTDHLTDMMNRRAFLIAAEDALEFCRRYDRSMATLMIDIDHFKQINDVHGHAAGDAAIKRIAEIIGNSIRGTDKAARFGGEEFVVLLREVDEENARQLAGRIRSSIEQEMICHGMARISATVSIGVAVFAAADRDIQDIIERSDQALYTAKNDGRNRVVFMPHPDHSHARAA